MSKSFIFLVKSFLGNYWRFLTGHTDGDYSVKDGKPKSEWETDDDAPEGGGGGFPPGLNGGSKAWRSPWGWKPSFALLSGDHCCKTFFTATDNAVNLGKILAHNFSRLSIRFYLKFVLDKFKQLILSFDPHSHPSCFSCGHQYLYIITSTNSLQVNIAKIFVT